LTHHMTHDSPCVDVVPACFHVYNRASRCTRFSTQRRDLISDQLAVLKIIQFAGVPSLIVGGSIDTLNNDKLIKDLRDVHCDIRYLLV
jgi:hypothetical protein